ncbi:ribonuclease HII [Agrilactobacillus yilanensis]|uniref:Ribonuclease HII n=1 Tax=Agrilactobacillus yilanensis TaxID=2485997 RepID=A0ABW4J8I9_9LACO|nr:ribonuclease HII [Agrilactobacillus yilanensis]
MTKSKSIAQLKALLAAGTLSPAELSALATDPRKGVQKLLQQHEAKLAQQATLQRAFLQRSQLERDLWQQGQLPAGIDEVGRGPLAGPVITCAIILKPSFDLWLVNDSKQLSDQKRRQLYPEILAQAQSVSLGVADNRMIDQLNIYEATRQAMAQAVRALSLVPSTLLVDAMNVPVEIPQQKLIHGDAQSISIAAASIVAKVVRDDLMQLYGRVYPGYDFEHNMGYGTKAHLTGLATLGPTPIHRFSFSPVQKAKS